MQHLVVRHVNRIVFTEREYANFYAPTFLPVFESTRVLYSWGCGLNYHLNMLHSAVQQQGASGSQSQPTITSVLGRRVCDSTKAEGITQRICNMVTTDMLPINVVDGQGFREVIQYIAPGYDIPSRTTITTCVEASK